jgi:hypothetical protein
MLTVIPDADVNQIEITDIAEISETIDIDDALVTMQPKANSSYYTGNAIERTFNIGKIECPSKDAAQKIVIPADGNYKLEA